MAQHVCGTAQLTDDQIALQEKLVVYRHRSPAARQAAQVQYVPIRFHVLRRDDGTGGTSVAALNQALVTLNQLYQPTGITYYLCGSTPHYINSTTLFDYDNSEEETLAGSNDVSNAINIYLPSTITYLGSQVSGYSYFPASLAVTNRIFVDADQLTDYTLAHELGHYFNLYHTFQSNKSSNTASRELVIRPTDLQQGRPFAANCTVAGDFVCDTPADPYALPGAVVSGCVYSGTITDVNGDLFSPATDNIMSYYITCSKAHTFTAGQYERMAGGLSIRLDPGNAYTLTCVDNSAVAPTNLAASMVAGGALLQFNYSGANAAGFLIERSLEPAANFTVVGSLPPGSFSFTDGSLTSNTTYYYRVKASNATTQYSTVVAVQAGLFYCIPAYGTPISGFAPKIADFMLAGNTTTLRSIATDAGINGYSDFSTVQQQVSLGHVYSFTASALTGNSGSFVNQHLSIWLDSNQDGLFSATERLFQSSASKFLNPTLTGTLTIPTLSLPGPTRLRLRSQYAPDGLVDSPCDLYNYGETEDYTLFIASPALASCFSLSASSTTVHCADSRDGSISLMVTGGTAPFSYSLNSLSATTGTFTGLAAGSYTATVTDANACRSSLVITLDPPAVATARLTGSTTVCAGQPTALTILASGGTGPYQLLLTNGLSTSTLTGYVSGNPIPVFPDHTTSYTLQTLTDSPGCLVSLAVASATITVNAITPASISPDNASACRGQSLTLTANSGTQYRWNTGQTAASLIVSESGTYSVTVTSPAGCSSTAGTSVRIVDCVQSVLFRAKVLLEGFANATTGLMNTQLTAGNLLPKQQPYSASPWSYSGTEQVTVFPANVTDWVLVMVRNALGTVLFKKAAFLRNDGLLISPDGTEGVPFAVVTEPIYASIHHRNHLAILSSQPIASDQLIDFTTDGTAARSGSLLQLSGGARAMYVGDFDANDIINNEDFNKWKMNASAVGHYLSIDSDGNGVINNQDFNHWKLNRSKIGTPGL